jgi:hypothetical protein
MKNKTATKDILVLISSIFLTFVISSCHHANEPELSGGKRNYTWTLDTIWYTNSQYPDLETYMSTIWASSPQDVYVGGFSSLLSIGVLYHYDGNRWQRIALHVSEGGYINGAFHLQSIYGFRSSNIWAVGTKQYDNPSPPPNSLDSSFIIHYDGTAWTESPIERGRSLYTIWGTNSHDIWAGGDYGTLYHYDGSNWIKQAFDTLMYFNSISGFSSTNMYATCGKHIDLVQPYDSSQYFLYHYDGMQWSPIDSFMVTVDHPEWKFGLNLWSTDKLYASTYGVFSRQGTGWRQLLANDLVLHVGGSGNDNIFAVGDKGRIFEWNGTDWKRFTEIEHPQIQWMGVWTDNAETFIVGMGGLKSYVMHGK